MKIKDGYAFGVIRTDDDFNPLICIREILDGEVVGEICFPYNFVETMVKSIEAVEAHPGIFSSRVDNENDNRPT